MKLSEKDSQLFFKLMFALQYYINGKYDIIKNVKSFKDFINQPLSAKKIVRDYLFEHIDIIDEFIEDNAHELDRDEIDILLSWKHFISRKFIIERFLSKYAVFIAEGKIYAVQALQESFTEVLQNQPTPIYVKTVLIPFKGQIVYDGILEPYGISFGDGVKTIIKDSYRNAKESGTIIHDLLAAQSEVDTLPTQKIRKELSKLIAELQKAERNLESCQLSASDANQIMNLLKGTVQYVVQRFSASDNYGDDDEKAYRQFRKLKQVFNRFERG
jgi:hypothetical protein